MRKVSALVLGLFCFMLISCNKTYIKGTEIEDVPENRAVLKVFHDYVSALKNRDEEKLLSVVSEKYYDYNGTDDPEDDVDYEGIKKVFSSKEFEKLIRIDPAFVIKDLTIEGDTAKLLYFYEVKIKKQTEVPAQKKSITREEGTKWLNVSDNNQMILKKENGQWKIINGL